MKVVKQSQEGSISFFDSTISNNTGVITSADIPRSGYYLASAEKYAGDSMIQYFQKVRAVVSGAGVGSIDIQLPFVPTGGVLSIQVNSDTRDQVILFSSTTAVAVGNTITIDLSFDRAQISTTYNFVIVFLAST